MTVKFWANFQFDRKLANYVFKKYDLKTNELNENEKIEMVIIWLKDKIKKDEEFIKKTNEKINRCLKYNKKHQKIGYLKKEEDKLYYLEQVWKKNDNIDDFRKIITNRELEIMRNKDIINKMNDFIKKNIYNNI
jgi:hypothetical protein